MAENVKDREVRPMWGASQEELKKFWLSLPKARQVTTRFPASDDSETDQEFYSQENPHMRTIIVGKATAQKLPEAKKGVLPLLDVLPSFSAGAWHADGEPPMFEEKSVPLDEAAAQAAVVQKKLNGKNHQCYGMTASGKRCQRVMKGPWTTVLDNCFQHNGTK